MVSDVSIAEGNGAVTVFTFTVSLSATAQTDVTFNIATAPGTATALTDYMPKSETGRTIPTGSSSATFTVQVMGDEISESNETFFVNVSSVVGATVVDSQGLGTIQNDDVPPPTVTSISPASGPSSGGGAVTITGTNFTGATAVTFGATAAASFTVNSATSITATSPANSAGTYDITVTTAGGTSATSAADQYTFVAAPTVTALSPTAGPTGGGTTVIITGTGFSAAPGTGAVRFGVTNASYTINSNTQITATSPAGTGTVDVRVSTAGGTSATSAADQFTYVAPPTAPAVLSPAEGEFRAARDVNLTGTAQANATISITGSYTGTATANGSGDWAVLLPAVASDGPVSVSVTATNAGGVSPATTRSWIIDTTAPAAPTITQPVNGAVLADGWITIAGRTELRSTVSLRINGGAPVAADVSYDNWSYAPPSTLADGVYALSVVTTDEAGNTGPVATSSFTVDSTPPATPTVASPVSGSVTGDNTPTISGTAEAGSTVTVTLNNTALAPVTAYGSGIWTTTSIPLADGLYTISVVAVNAAGIGAAAWEASVFTVDTTAPSAPVISTPTDGAVTDDGTPTISGSTEAGSTVSLSIDGGAPISIVPTGGAWSYTPPSMLSAGEHALVATAVDAAGNSSPASASVSFTYSPLAITTASLPSGQVGVAYAATVAVAGGTAPYGFAVTAGALPNGVTLAAGGALSGTPTTSGTSAFTVTATDANSLSTSAAFSVTIAQPAPPAVTDVEDVDVTANPDGAGQPTAIDLSTAVSNAASIEIVTPPAHGGATVTGFQVLYVPEAGYFGTDSFTYRAVGFTDGPSAGPSGRGVRTSAAGSQGVSAEGTVTVQIAAPTLVLAGGAQPNGQVGVAYAQTLTASGGTAPYTFAVTAGALPAGISLAPDGTLSGSPVSGGAFNFTVTATDSSTGTGPFSISAAHTLTVAASTIAVAPASLPTATRGTAYSQSVTASGGVAPYTYAIATGALPAGLTLSPTGQISGTPTVTGSFTFGVRATDSATGAGPYAGGVELTLTVSAASLTVTPTALPEVLAGTPVNQQMQATGGQGGYTYAVTSGALPQGLTLSTAGVLGGRPTVAGTFVFTVTATDGFGNTGSVALSLTVTSRPDPSADPDVRGLNTAQAEAARRMAGTQMGNFSRRLEALHRDDGQGDVALDLRLDGHAFTPLDEGQRTMGELSQVLGRGLMQGRDVSDRDEMARMLASGRADGTTEGGLSAGGSSMQVGDGPAGPTSGPRVWVGGAISLGERDATTHTAEMSITSSGISAGVDMSVADNLDIGVGVGFGQENTDVGVDESRMEAKSWAGVAYGSWRPAESVFIDGMVGYGELGFDMRRRTPVDSSLVFGERDGATWFGSLAAGVDRTSGSTRWIGYGRLEMLTSDLDAFTETGSPYWALNYEARSVESLQRLVGLRYERDILRGHDRWTPGLRLEWRHEFADAGSQALRYADWLEGPAYLIGQDGWERSRLDLGLSLGWRSRNGWSWSGEYQGGFSDGETLSGLRITGAMAF
ncbi:putative Ig domain-containing protein [Brevundimonas sp.]|uniref:putative Ig domain-containing protein n=1 Tax=Brevundimonas sp. TaxID=1871086 RepID=UPI003D6D1FFC